MMLTTMMRKKLLFLCTLLVSSTMAWAEVTWSYSAGALTIGGSGAMDDYASFDKTPWGIWLKSETLDATAIHSISIGADVTHIGNNAFNGCSSLASVTIPANVTSIGNYAFQDCGNLTTVIFRAPALTNYGTTPFDGCSQLEIIYVPTEAAVTTYSSNSGWGKTFMAIGKELTANFVNGAYWCTYYNGYINADVDDNTTVYTVSVSGTNATLHEIEDGNIKAEEAVVLKSTQETITLTYNTDETTGDFSTNELKGVDMATAKAAYTAAHPEAVVYYTLANEGGLGFYQYIGTTLGANKAFLPLDAAVGSAPEFYLFSFDDNMTTGVNDVRSKMAEGRGEYYNLNGQRVAQPTKGLYIVNGRKLLVP